MAVEAHILVVDDDPEIRELLQAFLQQHHYQVSVAADGLAMQTVLDNADNTVDLAILDIMMPGESGLEICRRLREHSALPIIMLTALDSEVDRIVGLEMGADDYLAKPFSPRELLARIKALLRRAQGNLAQTTTASHLFQFEGWQLDINKRRLCDPEKTVVPLSASEYDLLLLFLENPGKTLTRDELLQMTRNREAGPFDRTIDVQISRLRRKIEADPKDPHMIQTVRGGGYVFTAKVSSV